MIKNQPDISDSLSPAAMPQIRPQQPNGRPLWHPLFCGLAATMVLMAPHSMARTPQRPPAPLPAPTPAPAPAPPPASLVQACAGHEDPKSWDIAAPPAKIHGSTYYVGTCGIAAILIDSPDGLILIDAATEKGGPAVVASIRALGFDPAKIRLLLTTHEHMDHAGGLALIQRISGAPMLAMPSAHTALSTGQPDPDDPQHAMLPSMQGLRISASLQDGVPLVFGTWELTPYSTPVHTNGSTSYRWKSCESGRAPSDETPDDTCVTIAFMDSLSTPAPSGYRFSEQADQRRRIQTGFDKASQLSCNLLITPHPSASALMERMAGQNALVQEGACAHYVATAKVNFQNRLAKETE